MDEADAVALEIILVLFSTAVPESDNKIIW